MSCQGTERSHFNVLPCKPFKCLKAVNNCFHKDFSSHEWKVKKHLFWGDKSTIIRRLVHMIAIPNHWN